MEKSLNVVEKNIGSALCDYGDRECALLSCYRK